MVIKNLENKIKLVLIICSLFLTGCIIISISSIWTARTMVNDAHQKVYVLDGTVPILVNRSTMEETLDVEAKSHVEMFHQFFFTLAPDDKYIKYTTEKAMSKSKSGQYAKAYAYEIHVTKSWNNTEVIGTG